MRKSIVIGGAALAFVLAPRVAHATTINVGPGDSYDKIEGAKAGDEVVIAPGTYKFRVYLQEMAPAATPIIIRAQDPANPPVWDLGMNVEDAPGSYTAGDKGRGCWQIAGDNYRISGIVFKNCTTASHNAGGIRYYQADPGKGGHGIVIRDCKFIGNDNGLTGGALTTDATVEYCEFSKNGNLMAPASAPTHNIYVYAGTFTLRYSYLHDSTQGQNLHCRAHNALIEGNWLARAASFEAQFDSPDDPPQQPFTQSVMFRGNVVVQNATPGNKSKVLTLYNDATLNETIALRAIGNTFIGNGGSSAFVQLADGNPTDTAELTNNILFGTDTPAIDGTITGSNNWVTMKASTAGLTGSVVGTDPGFTNDGTYRLAAGSACIGKANAAVMGAPAVEYYLDEKTICESRQRVSALDIGAFESTTTGPGIGPYGAEPDAGTSGGADGSIGGGNDSGANDNGTSFEGGEPDGPTGTHETDPLPPGEAKSGCGCTHANASDALGPFALGVIAMGAILRRDRRRARGRGR